MSKDKNHGISIASSQTEDQLFENQIKKISVPIHLKPWLRLDEALALFPFTESQLKKHKRYGIPGHVIHKKLVFKREELEQWFEEQAV